MQWHCTPQSHTVWHIVHKPGASRACYEFIPTLTCSAEGCQLSGIVTSQLRIDLLLISLTLWSFARHEIIQQTVLYRTQPMWATINTQRTETTRSQGSWPQLHINKIAIDSLCLHVIWVWKWRSLPIVAKLWSLWAICFVCFSNGTSWGVRWVDGYHNQVICYDILPNETQGCPQPR